jgi:hypothetical protein
MEFILEFKNFFKEGDKVLVEYWYNDMITPVLIKEKKGKKYLISHDIPESKIRNAPDELISGSDIIDHFRKSDKVL